MSAKKTELPTLDVLADEARRSPVRVKLELDEAQRAVLAEENGLASVERFFLKATALGMKGHKTRVEGTLEAQLHYICGVTLKPYPAKLDVPFEQIYVRDTDTHQPVDIESLDEADIEPLVKGAARISDLGYQLFTLTLDPYPRHPDVAPPHEPEPEDDEDSPASPFAVLKDLKL